MLFQTTYLFFLAEMFISLSLKKRPLSFRTNNEAFVHRATNADYILYGL